MTQADPPNILWRPFELNPERPKVGLDWKGLSLREVQELGEAVGLQIAYKLIRYHRLVFDSVADGRFRSTYLPWIDSITHVKAGEKEEIELRLNSNYENVRRVLRC